MACSNKRKRESPNTEISSKDFTFSAGIFRSSKRRRQNCQTTTQSEAGDKTCGSDVRFCVGKSSRVQNKFSLRKRFSKHVSEHIIKSKLKNCHDYSLHARDNTELLQTFEDIHTNCLGYGINTDFLKLSQDGRCGDDTDKCRQTIKDNQGRTKLQQKLNPEKRIRQGILNLLEAQSTKSVDTVRSLLLSNATIVELEKELLFSQRDSELHKDQIQPCKATMSISELRIPIMWKDRDHFEDEGDHRRYTVFCIIKVGNDVQGTQLIRNVDRSLTDLTFSDVIVFNDISHDFQVNIEIYCHKQHEDFSIASTPVKIRKKLSGISGSIGRRIGKKLAGLNNSDITSDMVLGPKFHLIARGSLQLNDANQSVGTHKLEVLKPAVGTTCGLPFFGHYCCRLAVQPLNVSKSIVSGFLKIKKNEGEDNTYWCELRNKGISCWSFVDNVRSDDIETVIPLHRNTEIKRVLNSSFSVIGRSSELIIVGENVHHLAADKHSNNDMWFNGIEKHLLNEVSWNHAYEISMDILESFHPASQANVSKCSCIYEETPLYQAS